MRRSSSTVLRRSTSDLRQDLSKLKSELIANRPQNHEAIEQRRQKALDALASRMAWEKRGEVESQPRSELTPDQAGSDLARTLASKDQIIAQALLAQRAQLLYVLKSAARSPELSGLIPADQLSKLDRLTPCSGGGGGHASPSLAVKKAAINGSSGTPLPREQPASYTEERLETLRRENHQLLQYAKQLNENAQRLQILSPSNGGTPVDGQLPPSDDAVLQLMVKVLQAQNPLIGSPTAPDRTLAPRRPGRKPSQERGPVEEEAGAAVRDVARLREELNGVKAQLQQAEAEKKKYSSQLEISVTEHRLETESLRKSVKAKDDKICSLETQVKDLLSQNSFLTQEQVSSRVGQRDYESVTDECKKLSAEMAELTRQQQVLRDERDCLVIKCENFEAQVQYLQSTAAENEQLRADLRLTQRELQKREEEISQLQKAHDESAEEHDKSMHGLQGALNELKNNYQQQSVKYNDLLHELNRLKVAAGHSVGQSADAAAQAHPHDVIIGSDAPPVPITVYMAKYSYDPSKYSPNDNPEIELAVAKGDYVYIFGGMDEDGFFEGELLSGQRGLVPSNFVEPVNEHDLPHLLKNTLHKIRSRKSQPALANGGVSSARIDCGVQVLEEDIHNPDRTANLNDHRNSGGLTAARYLPSVVSGSSPPRSSVGDYQMSNGPASMGNAFRPVSEYAVGSNLSQNGDLSPSAEGPPAAFQEEGSVAPPTELIVEKMLLNSVLISWSASRESPKKIDCYDIYVDGCKRASVKPYAKLRTLLSEIDTKEAHKISIRTVTTTGQSSQDQQCTVVVGKAARLAPYDVKAINIASSCADVIWWPSNSSLAHALVVNHAEEISVPPGRFKYSLNNLSPSSVYKVSVRAVVNNTPNDATVQSNTVTKIEFKTLPGGLPDCPAEVRVQSGLQPGTLSVSWLPITISASGTSNGAVVTGYEVVRDGVDVVAAAESPTVDRVSVPIPALKGARRVAVRTTSFNGHSVLSKPAKLPSNIAAILADYSRSGQVGGSPSAGYSPSRSGPQQQQQGGKKNYVYSVNHVPEMELHPDYTGSEASDVSELSDIAEESELDESSRRAAAANYGPGGHFDVDSVAVPATMPSIFDYQHNLQQQSRRGVGGARSPRLRHPYSSPHHELPPPLPRSSAVPCKPPRLAYEEDMMGYHNHSAGPNSPASKGMAGGLRRGTAAVAAGGRPGDRRHRYFVALYNYDPATMSPNKEAAHEEMPFREGQVMKIYGDKDEDEFYYGETRDGSRGFVPSNMVMELRGNRRSAHFDTREKRLRERASTSSLRKMIALFDYDPRVNSPNPDAEDVELHFKAGDVMFVFGAVDEDGFYVAEMVSGERGLVPSNFLEECDDSKYVPTRGPPTAAHRPPATLDSPVRAHPPRQHQSKPLAGSGAAAPGRPSGVGRL